MTPGQRWSDMPTTSAYTELYVLYGVIHHCGADFGIVVSRGGFTRGAVDFAQNKPILFLDTDDLIAMQEGRDVLAKAFRKE